MMTPIQNANMQPEDDSPLRRVAKDETITLCNL